MFAKTDAAMTLANGCHAAVLDLVPSAKSEIPFMMTHSTFMSWAAVNIPGDVREVIEYPLN